MSTAHDDDPPDDDAGDAAVVLEVDGDGVLMYDPENSDAWIRTDTPAGLEASA